MLRRLAVCATILAAVLLLARVGWPARAPDVVKKTFSYSGEGGRAFAALLGMPPAPRTVLQLELSQATEHAALPERDKDLRDPDGALSSELDWRPSTQIHEVVTWDPVTGVLRFDGYVADMRTAIPAPGGLAYGFSSPWFTESESEKLPPGWKALIPRLAALPATAMSGGALVRKLEARLDGEERATLALWRVQTWDSKNNPVPKSYLRVEFGPTVSARRTNGEGGGGSRACGCRAGPAADGSGPAALGAAIALTLGRRPRRSTSRTPRPASPARPSPGSAPGS